MYEMKSSTALLVLLITLSCSSGRPPYTSDLESTSDASFVLTLESTNPMSADDMRRALLTEAARATIDRGRIYLRVDDLATDSRFNVRETVTTDSATPPTQASNLPEPAYRQEMSVSRRRSGTVRFTVFSESPGGSSSYDASRLLDRLQRGELP